MSQRTIVLQEFWPLLNFANLFSDLFFQKITKLTVKKRQSQLEEAFTQVESIDFIWFLSKLYPEKLITPVISGASYLIKIWSYWYGYRVSMANWWSCKTRLNSPRSLKILFSYRMPKEVKLRANNKQNNITVTPRRWTVATINLL